MGDAHTNELWVNLSALGEGNIFAVLPQLMRKMLEDTGQCPEAPEELFDLVLPSDDNWQTKIYYKLVERQRMVDNSALLMDDDMNMQNWIEEPPKPKLHDWNIQPKKKSIQCAKKKQTSSSGISDVKKKKRTGPVPITWTVSDIAKAGCLLTHPPIATEFEDEQEMRRVYTLIYDVFRYKNVLNQALHDIAFFLLHPELKQTMAHIWLLFYDLYHRSFKKRETAVAATAGKLFATAGLTNAEMALWQLRTKLAASVSRLRIEHNALSLSDLLPHHLRDERVTGQSANPVTCWINTKKIKNLDDLKKQIEANFNLKLSDADADDDDEALPLDCYRMDKHCPQIVAFPGSLRSELAKSDLVKNFKLIVQDKSFCLGPATFSKVVAELELTGSVIQSHVNSPRITAYLATILAQNEKIKKLMAFSAGQRKIEYETYFHQLGMSNVLIFADRLIDIPPDAAYMEEVVAVFATPPNSYSAVLDPIDLVCSRGGDLSMLEVLTESEESKEGKERVGGILEEQRKTLRFAMSRPQIQFVLYETHSELAAENDGMIQKTVKEVNKIAKLHHAALQGKLNPQPEAGQSNETIKEINNNENIDQFLEENDSVFLPDAPSVVTISNTSIDDKLFDSVVVPDTDIFDTPSLPNLCPGENSCLNLTKEGCFLSLLQRKQVIRLDNKYMIQMAEHRGLFGRTSTSSTRAKGSRGSRKNVKKPPTPPPKTKRRIKDTEVARIAAPTHTFLRHTKIVEEVVKCPRCQHIEEEEKVPMYRQWWSETTRHLMALKTTLVKNKIIPSNKSKINAKSIVDRFAKYNVDEIVAKSRLVDSVPIFPKLKLSRDDRKVEKVQLHMPVTMVEFF